MTQVRVDADAVAALGGAVAGLALELRDCAVSAAEESWAVGSGASARALGEVLGDFEHQRLVLGRHLDELGHLAQVAGALYAEVETGATVSMAGGSMVGGSMASGSMASGSMASGSMVGGSW